jgi:hypothetical protein
MVIKEQQGSVNLICMDSQGTHERSRAAADLPLSMIAVYENQSGTSSPNELSALFCTLCIVMS